MNFGAIKKNDVANGPGIRVNLFVSGCTHHCKNCFNKDTWNFDYGEEFTNKHLGEILDALAPDYVSGFTFLGGEPMEDINRGEVLKIAQAIKEKYPQKDIWIYTGYLVEELLVLADMWDSNRIPDSYAVPRNRVISGATPAKDASDLCKLLNLVDVIVDGEFVEEKKNLRLKFRGSENQRIIHMPSTIAHGEIIKAAITDRL